MYLLMNNGTPVPLGTPAAVEGVSIATLPATGSGMIGHDYATGLLAALLFTGLLIAVYRIGAWLRRRATR